jgi:RHS repeat-associated protein
LKSRADYYAFGSLLPGRNYSSDAYRFGFNGMEKDDEMLGATGTSYDFGARLLDPRVGRWLSLDPLAGKYPGISPYSFALNTPIQAKDPDGRVVIFINGMHAGTGGTRAYWGGYDARVTHALGDHSARYVDGAMGGLSNTISRVVGGGSLGGVGGPWGMALGVGVGYRNSNLSREERIKAGHAQGMTDAADIIRNLKEGETIKIVAHSMGVAYADGYTSGIMEYAALNGLLDKVNIEFELDVNAYQGAELGDPWVKSIDRYNKTGGLDGGGWNILETGLGNSVPTVAPVPGSTDITDVSDADKGHAINEMSTTGIPNLGNGGDEKCIEQGSNNAGSP